MSGVLHAGATAARIDAALAASPAHLHPVLIAVRDHRVGMLFTSQGSGPFAIPTKTSRPAIVLVGDDFEQSTGPEGFHMPSIRRAIRACASFTIVTSVPTAEVYAAGTVGAVAGRNVMIIETRLAHEFQWLSLVQKLAPGRPILLSTVKGGTA